MRGLQSGLITESAIPAPGRDLLARSWLECAKRIVTRAGTPPAIIHKVQRDMAEALQNDEVRAKLADLGLEARQA